MTSKTPSLGDDLQTSSQRFHAIPGVAALGIQINAHKTALASIYKQQNAFALINKLPAQLLSEILLICKPEVPEDDVASKNARPQRAAFARRINNLVNVCSHWRTLGLATPGLWNSILLIGTRSEWAMFALSYSKNTPLLVQLAVEDVSVLSKEDIRTILSHLPRIRTLQLQMPPELFEELRPQLSLPAPKLETFCVVAATGVPPRKRSDNDERPLPIHPLNIPKDIFSNNIPQLSCILLDRASARWDGPLFGEGITELYLSYIPAKNNPFSYAELWKTLANVPNLKILELTSAVADIYDREEFIEQPRPKRLIRLPNLTHLEISQSADTIELILRSVVFPYSTKLNLTLGWGGGDRHTVGAILNRVEERYSKGKETCKALHVHTMGDFQIIRAFADIPTNLRSPDVVPDVYIEWESPSSVPKYLHVCHTIVQIFPWKKIEAMHLNAIRDWDNIMWYELIDAPKLHTLSLQGACGDGFAQVFEEILPPPVFVRSNASTKRSNKKKKSELPFRQLKYLSFDSMDVDFLEDLLPLLTERRQANAKLDTLSISRCKSVSGTVIATLRKGNYVNKVKIDREPSSSPELDW